MFTMSTYTCYSPNGNIEHIHKDKISKRTATYFDDKSNPVELAIHRFLTVYIYIYIYIYIQTQ